MIGPSPHRLPWLCLALLPICGCREGAPPASGPAAARQRPVLVVEAPSAPVGFDQPVRLRGRVERGPAGWRWKLRFDQVWGPPLRHAEHAAGELRFRSRRAPRWTAEQRRRSAAGNLLPVSAFAAGRQVIRVTATATRGGAAGDTGTATRLERTVEVLAAHPAASWPRMAAAADHYLAGASSTWRAVRARITFTRAHKDVTRARVAGGGWHAVVTPSGARAKIRGGTWLGDADCGRVDCHPREQRGWQQTAHASVFTRGISGELDRASTRGPYQQLCVGCHTLGYQPGAANDGFSHRAERLGWRLFVPAGGLTPSSWAGLAPALKQRANVQCESCHGPGWFYVGYGVDICAQCHDHPPQYRKLSQLRSNRMLAAHQRLTGPFAPATDNKPRDKAGAKDQRYVCGSCHTAAGYLESQRGHRSGSVPERDLTTAQHGVTCVTCHDPHGAGCDKQLRLCGMVETPGLTFDAGQGALCISCHTGEANVVSGPLLRPFVPGQPGRETASGQSHGQREGRPAARAQRPRDPLAAPHAPQFQLLTSRGGKFLRLPSRAVARAPNPHLLVPDSCAGCHVSKGRRRLAEGGHSFRLAPARNKEAPLCTGAIALGKIDLGRVGRSPSTEPCRPCHGDQPRLSLRARADHDRDGRIEGLVEEVTGLLRQLGERIGERLAARPRRGSSTAAAHVAIVDERLVLADAACRPLRSAKGAPLPLPVDQPALVKAAFNALMVLRDGSGGLHNPRYVARLLRQSIVGLAN